MSHEFSLGVSHNQAALRGVSWNPDSDLNRITDGSPYASYPVQTDVPAISLEDLEDEGF